MASDSETHGRPVEADLVGYQLGLCDEHQRREIGQALSSSPELVQRLSRLKATLALLDADPSDPPPIDLNQRILARIEATGRTIRLSPAFVPEGGTDARPLFTLRELVGLAAAIAIFVGIFVPGYRTARMAARLAVCRNNLRQVDHGFSTYAMAYDGNMPFVGSSSGKAAWLAGDDMEVPVLGNSRNVYQLVRDGYTAASAFKCPDRSGDWVMRIDDPRGLDGFPSPRNNSYATQFMVLPLQRQALSPMTPIAADLTPLVDEHRRLLREPPPENSQSHVRAGGQNVLRSDGGVIFTRTPRVGVEDDDIYRVIGVERYTGTERPQLRSDAFLVP